MAKTDLTKQIEMSLWKHTMFRDNTAIAETFGAFEVDLGCRSKCHRKLTDIEVHTKDGLEPIQWLSNRSNYVDYMTIDRKSTVRCYEIKVSKSDFKSSARVGFYGHYNYYVVPVSLYTDIKDLIPKGVGCYIYDETYKAIACVKRATKQKLHSSDIGWCKQKALQKLSVDLYKTNNGQR